MWRDRRVGGVGGAAGVAVAIPAAGLVYLWLNWAYPVGVCQPDFDPGLHTLECLIDAGNTYQAHAGLALAVAAAAGLVVVVAGAGYGALLVSFAVAALLAVLSLHAAAVSVVLGVAGVLVVLGVLWSELRSRLLP